MNLLDKFKRSDNKLTNEDLELRAAGVTYTVFTISDMIAKAMEDKIDELKKLNEEERSSIFFTISYVTLFHAQKFFWERVIKNEKQASLFEHYLYMISEKVFKLDFKPYIQDIVNYVSKGDPSMEVQYIGSKICKKLGKEDAFLMLEISTLYASYLTHGMFESFDRAWNMPKVELQKIIDATNKD